MIGKVLNLNDPRRHAGAIRARLILEQQSEIERLHRVINERDAKMRYAIRPVIPHWACLVVAGMFAATIGSVLMAPAMGWCW